MSIIYSKKLSKTKCTNPNGVTHKEFINQGTRYSQVCTKAKFNYESSL